MLEKFILGIIIYMIGVLLGGLIFWGVGNFIIWVFEIDYTWTIFHGLACQLIYMIIKEMMNFGENR